jgi:hypothetical protein
MEQRYQAVLEVQAGVPVVDVAMRFRGIATGRAPVEEPIPVRWP